MHHRFVAIKDGTAGMVTAGHCNEGDPYNGGVNNQRFDQPSTINFIGYEDLDPPFSSKPGCTYIYSPIGKIFIDLSVSSTWDVCTSGC